MNKKEFEDFYSQAKEKVDEYESQTYRTAVIAGLFCRNAEETFTGRQVGKILELRYPEIK